MIDGLMWSELAFLTIGLGVYVTLWFWQPNRVWAISRLLAEINRSVRAIGRHHMYPRFLLMRVRLPSRLRPLLRTLNVLHLQSSRVYRFEKWELHRDEYVKNRLADSDPRIGQLAYYRRRRSDERRWLVVANVLFVVCSVLAVACVITKIAHPKFAEDPDTHNILAGLAIFGPPICTTAS